MISYLYKINDFYVVADNIEKAITKYIMYFKDINEYLSEKDIKHVMYLGEIIE